MKFMSTCWIWKQNTTNSDNFNKRNWQNFHKNRLFKCTILKAGSKKKLTIFAKPRETESLMAHDPSQCDNWTKICKDWLRNYV